MRILVRRPGETNIAPEIHVDALCSSELAGIPCGSAILYDSISRHVFEITEEGAVPLNVLDKVQLLDDSGNFVKGDVSAISISFTAENGSIIESETKYKLETVIL